MAHIDSPTVTNPAPSSSASIGRAELGRLAFAIGATFGAYALYALTRFHQFLASGYDLGIFDQVVRAYSRFHAPLVPLKGPSYNIFGDHFHPIIASLAPLYWIWNDPRTLLIAQAALVALSAVPVWRFTRRRFGATVSLLAVLAYLWCWPLQELIDFDFHEVAFAIPLLAWLIDAMDRRAKAQTAIACALLLITREDLGAVVAVAGALVAVRGSRRFGAALVAVGLAALYLTTAVLIPHFAQAGRYAYWSYPALGASPGEALRTMVTRPWHVIATLWTPSVKVQTFAWLVLPTGLLSLASPYALLVLPILLERFLNSRPNLWTTQFHYSSVFAPVLFLAALDTLHRIWRRRPDWRWLPTLWLAPVVAFTIVGTGVIHKQFPLGRLFNGAAYTTDARMTAIRQSLPEVPPGVCVAVDDRIAPQLTARDHVTIAGLYPDHANWAVLDVSQVETTLNGPVPTEWVGQLEANGFNVVSHIGPIVVLHLDAPEPAWCATP